MLFRLRVTVIYLGMGLFTGWAADCPARAAKSTVTDSLVRDLPCGDLREDNVLAHLQPDAFSITRQLPARNWASGQGLAECWSLSHAQRLLFYFGRFGQPDVHETSDLSELLKIWRGETSVTPFVFPLASVASLYRELESQPSEDWRSAIEAYEDLRFYEPQNLKLLFGGRDRSPATNERTYAALGADVARGWLPIVILRPGLMDQHAVLVKRMRTENSRTAFVVYDSNYPERENTLYYDEVNHEFTAPDIVGSFATQPDAPIGVFRVDTPDMRSIAQTLFHYYQNRCQTVKN